MENVSYNMNLISQMIFLLMINLSFSSINEKAGAFMLTRLQYSGGGDWYGDPSSIPNLLEFIDNHTNVDVNKKENRAKIGEDEFYNSYYIYLTILDNGVGFESIDKKKMLTPYFTTKKKGTGLGLAIVSKIISDHNSQILFNSVEEGAKVEISIPKKNEQRSINS